MKSPCRWHGAQDGDEAFELLRSNSYWEWDGGRFPRSLSAQGATSQERMKPGQMCKIDRIGPSSKPATTTVNWGYWQCTVAPQDPGSSEVIFSTQPLPFCTQTLRLRPVPKPQTRPPEKNSKKERRTHFYHHFPTLSNPTLNLPLPDEFLNCA